MRQQIEALEAEVRVATASARGWQVAAEKSREAADLQRREIDELENAIREVCEDSALLPPNEVKWDGHPPDVFHHHVVERCALIYREFGPDDDLLTGPRMRYVDSYTVKAEITDHPERFERLIHVRVHGLFGVGYRVSMQALAGMKHLPRVLNSVLGPIAALLSKQANEFLGRKFY